MIDHAIIVVDLFQYVRIVRLLLLGRSHQGTDASSVMSVKFSLGLALASDYSSAVGLARWGARSRCRIIPLKFTYATAVDSWTFLTILYSDG